MLIHAQDNLLNKAVDEIHTGSTRLHKFIENAQSILDVYEEYSVPKTLKDLQNNANSNSSMIKSAFQQIKNALMKVHHRIHTQHEEITKAFNSRIDSATGTLTHRMDELSNYVRNTSIPPSLLEEIGNLQSSLANHCKNNVSSNDLKEEINVLREEIKKFQQGWQQEALFFKKEIMNFSPSFHQIANRNKQEIMEAVKTMIDPLRKDLEKIVHSGISKILREEEPPSKEIKLLTAQLTETKQHIAQLLELQKRSQEEIASLKELISISLKPQKVVEERSP